MPLNNVHPTIPGVRCSVLGCGRTPAHSSALGDINGPARYCCEHFGCSASRKRRIFPSEYPAEIANELQGLLDFLDYLKEEDRELSPEYLPSWVGENFPWMIRRLRGAAGFTTDRKEDEE